MTSRRIPLIVGLVLALGTGVLMLTYLGRVRASAAAPSVRHKVLVAAHDLAARAPISPRDITVVERPANDIDVDAIDAPQRAIGKIALITIPAGSAITRSKIGTTPAYALPTRLKNGLRAVSISIDRVKGVSGLIEPGDRVDVIAIPPRVGDETPRATTILRGALVLAMGNETEVAQATPSPANENLTTVTLAVTTEQADLLALADVDTTLRLALRPPLEPVAAFKPEPLVLGTNGANAAPPPPAAPAP
ncbi:MAG: Flp pilus assembly protein CpaB, partial [Candidatus Eremiobacteraeota bacterium]|nr:Flp pilus assembly protein CpaB [Candidatus Eremiobacteraeota bacterium]